MAYLAGSVVRRQLRIFFLDWQGAQVATIAPIYSVPIFPTGNERVDLAPVIKNAVRKSDVDALMIFLERPGGADLSESDHAWTAELREVSLATGVPLRAVLVSHRTGVRCVEPDDYER